MGSLASTDFTTASPAEPGSKRRRRRQRRKRLWAVAAAIAALLLIAIPVGLGIAHSDSPGARALTERELRGSSLQPGEEVITVTSAFQRPALDYFRATRGVLALTNRRLYFLGVEPKDPLSVAEGPQTFRERSFPVDTLVKVYRGRTFFLLAPAIVVNGPMGRAAFGIPPGALKEADALLAAVAARHRALYAEGVRQAALRRAATRATEVAEQEARKPQFYTVQRGDALASIAARYNTTPDKLRQWNGITGNSIKVGQQLMVRPAAP